MQIEPLKKELYERAKKLGVDAITLEFSGGSDEGYLYAHAEGPPKSTDANEEGKALRKKVWLLASAVEEWAWTVYDYSGAGDGSSYGDNITYDFKNGKMHSQEWYQVEQQGEVLDVTLETR
jgi:hypothetical protein